MRYTAFVVWLDVKRNGDYRRGIQRESITANSIAKASEMALALHKNKICPAISMIWYDWPQPIQEK